MVRPASLAYLQFWNLMDWIYPPVCAGCNQPASRWCDACSLELFPATQAFCPVCGYPSQKSEVCNACHQHPPQYMAAKSLAPYRQGVRHALHQLKYQSRLDVGQIFHARLMQAIVQANWNVDTILPIPVSKTRRRSRGYNQAAIIAWPLSISLGIPYNNHALQKQKDTSSQVAFKREERFSNINGAFRVTDDSIAGKQVLIVDDVITTGATINESATVLMEAGAKVVYALSIGRTMLDDISS